MMFLNLAQRWSALQSDFFQFPLWQMERLRDRNHQDTVLSPIYWWSPRRKTWPAGGGPCSAKKSTHQAEAKLTEIHVSLLKETKSYNKTAEAHALVRGTTRRSWRSWNTASGLAVNIRMLNALLCDILSVLAHAKRYPHSIECHWESTDHWALWQILSDCSEMWQFGCAHVNTRDVLSQQYPSQIYSKVITLLLYKYVVNTWHILHGLVLKEKITDEVLTGSPVNTYYVQNHNTRYLWDIMYPTQPLCKFFSFLIPYNTFLKLFSTLSHEF